MTADGKLIECNRENNKELFSIVLGGYGLFGVILDVKLKVIQDQILKFKSYKLKTNQYLDYYENYIDADSTVQLVFGRLNISSKKFLEEATLNFFQSTLENVHQNHPIEGSEKLVELKNLVFRSTINSEYGKRLRWNLENNIGEFSSKKVFTRNQVLNDDVSLVENNDSTSTDILHEYFIPKRNFNLFIDGMKQILPNEKIDLLNITLRNVYPDNDSFLSYVKEEVFAFVMLFNQKISDEHELEMRKLTNDLAQLAYDVEGTYYLPYRLHVEKALFKKVYPRSDEFFQIKLKYDPQELFQNKFYLQYK